MKKGKMIVSAMALVLALGAAFAFKGNTASPGNLYYWNSAFMCVKAPCATYDEIGNLCDAGQMYTDAGCGTPYLRPAYTTDGGGN